MKYVLITVLLLGAMTASRHSFHAGAAILVTVAAVLVLKKLVQSINTEK